MTFIVYFIHQYHDFLEIFKILPSFDKVVIQISVRRHLYVVANAMQNFLHRIIQFDKAPYGKFKNSIFPVVHSCNICLD